MRMIDKDALLSDIERTIGESGCVNHEGEIMDCVRYAPTIDAVPVVRCKDCRFLGDENIGLHDCDHFRGPMRVELDDYCSYGEKMESEGGT